MFRIMTTTWHLPTSEFAALRVNAGLRPLFVMALLATLIGLALIVISLIKVSRHHD